jgi:hypothetical protein
MTKMENLQRDIDTMHESIRLDWLDLAEKPFVSQPEQMALKQSIGMLMADLNELAREIDAIRAGELRATRSTMD